jgi:hypothetical protein
MARRWGSSAPALAGSVIVVAVVGVIIPLVIARHYGASGIPRADDWSYLRALFHWVDTGRFDFNNFVSMTLLGQLVLATPVVKIFGNDIAAVQTFTAVLGLVGLLAVVWLGVLVTGRLWVATFVAVLVAVGPLWGPLSMSYMTDVPAFVFSVLACTLGARAFTAKPVSLPYLVGALVASFAGLSIRQYAIVPMIALVLLGAWTLWREGRGRRWWTFVLVVAAIVVASVVLFAYWRTIPNLKSLSPAVPDSHSLRTTFYKSTGMLRLAGLLLAPALVLAGPVQIVKRAWARASGLALVLTAAVALVLVYAAAAAPKIALAGNYVLPNGVLGNGVIDGNRPDILPSGGWELLVAVGTVGALLLVLAVVPPLADLGARLQARDLTLHEPVVVLLALVIVGYSAAYFLATVSGLPMADRYILPLLPLIAVLLLRDQSPAVEAEPVTSTAPVGPRFTRARLVGAGVALVLVMAVGVTYALDSASFDGTRWKVAVAATRDGWAPTQIRAGFEWTNFYARGPRGSRRTEPCVRVLVNPPGGARDPFVFKDYRSPFNDPVVIGAIQTDTTCSPSGHVPGTP